MLITADATAIITICLFAMWPPLCIMGGFNLSFSKMLPYDDKQPCSVETSQYLDNWENNIWFDYLKETHTLKESLHSFTLTISGTCAATCMFLFVEVVWSQYCLSSHGFCMSGFSPNSRWISLSRWGAHAYHSRCHCYNHNMPVCNVATPVHHGWFQSII